MHYGRVKLYLRCHTCTFPCDENGKQQEPVTDEKVGASIVDVCDDSVYEVRCNNGHTSFTVIQNLKWELLFDSGVLALRDGFHREAVASCTCALEEFYAFYVRVILRAHNVPAGNFDRFRRDTRLSERRLGAMHF